MNTPREEGRKDQAVASLENIILGRECRYAFLVIASKISELIHQRMHATIEDMGKEGYHFQRIPSGTRISEGYGLLKDIFMKRDQETTEEAAEAACGHYELWRFFTDDEVEDGTWKRKLSHFMGEINMLQPLDRMVSN